MVDAIGIAGTAEQARDRLQAVAEVDCVSRCIVGSPQSADASMVKRTVQTLAPSAR